MSTLSTWVTVAFTILFLKAALAQQPVSGSADADRQLILQFRNSIDNWVAFKNASGFVGWDDTAPLCTWGGIKCSQAGRVTGLILGCQHCNVKASGNLLPSLALLDQLQELHLDRNWFNGTLPSAFAYGFPALTSLRLDFNSLTGVIPPDWGQPGAFPSLQHLNIGGNQLKGRLPEMGVGAMSKLQIWGMQWNMLFGSIPASWRNLRAKSIWVRPGNYQLCGGKPANATFELCKEIDGKCEDTHTLGEVCALEIPATPRMMPPPTANPTMLEAVLRVEGANIIPFTANNLNIFVTAVVAQLPNVTAKDIVISQVIPVVSLNRGPSQANGRQLGVPTVWPAPDPQQRLPSGDPRLTGYTVDDSLANGGYTSAVTIVGGRRRLSGSPGSKGAWGLQARHRTRGLLTDSGASPPTMSPMRKTPVKPGLRGPNIPGVTIIIGGDVGGQRSGQEDAASGGPTPAPMLGMAPTGLLGAPAGGMSPQITAGPHLPDPDPDAESDNAVASAPIAPRPYGTPVPGGVLVGADISMQIRTIVNGNVSEAEDMVAQMTTSSIFITRLQQAGLGVVHVLLVSCEPLDPEELPVRLRPPPYNVTFPLQGLPTSNSAPAASHFPIGITVGAVGGAFGLIMGAIGVLILIVWSRKKRLHPSGTPISTLNETQSTDVLKHGDGNLDSRGSTIATSGGTPSHGSLRGQASLRTLNSESSGGRLLSQRSSDLGAMSDATLIARLGNEHTAGTALQQIAERQAMGMQASPSGQEHGLNSWADKQYSLGKQGSSIELPKMPWSDWEVSGDQIEICKRPDGMDWELGAGAFGKVFKALRGGVQVVAVKILHDAEVGGMNFVREIAILKGCRHTNIVQFQGACISGDKTMLVMEFVEGGDLWRNLQRPGSRVGNWYLQGRKVALDIARGLCFLHAHSIVLFDLKSHNVLLTRDGTGKIADVGLAKVLTQGYVSKLDEVAGTFAWAAPELLMGGRCSDKVDIYSFGVVLWELATCERPQRGAMRDVRVPEEVPEEVAQLMNECMAYHPNERPSAKEIYARLSAVQTSGDGSSSATGSKGGSSSDKSTEQQPALGPEGKAGLPEVQGHDKETYRDVHRELEAAEVRQKTPTPLGVTRLPIRSAFDMSE